MIKLRKISIFRIDRCSNSEPRKDGNGKTLVDNSGNPVYNRVLLNVGINNEIPFDHKMCK